MTRLARDAKPRHRAQAASSWCSGWGSVLVVEVWRGLVVERREEWVERCVAGCLPVGWGRYVVGVARWGCDRVSS